MRAVQHRLMSPAFALQRAEVQHPVVAGDHDLAVDQDRLRLDHEHYWDVAYVTAQKNDDRDAVAEAATRAATAVPQDAPWV